MYQCDDFQPARAILKGMGVITYLYNIVIGLDQILILDIFIPVCACLLSFQLVVDILGKKQVAINGMSKVRVADIGRDQVQFRSVLLRLGRFDLCGSDLKGAKTIISRNAEGRETDRSRYKVIWLPLTVSSFSALVTCFSASA
jgi:hypothetical protein